jgi:cobalt-precorrin-7 (C5)-methyltransferase
MKIVGVGCGPGMLTDQARVAIQKSHAIYGSKRSLDLVRPHLREDCEIHVITDFRALNRLPEDAVLLSTGDPMLAGLGFLEGEILPGISSLQVAAARLRLPLSNMAIAVAHGREPAPALQTAKEEIEREKWVFLVADPDFSVPSLAAAFLERGLHPILFLCEELGYPDEKIRRGTVEDPPIPISSLFSIVILPESYERKIPQ